MSNSLQNEIRFLKGVGFRKARDFEILGIRTVEDLLLHLPRLYLERKYCQKISGMKPGLRYTIILKLKSVKQAFLKGGRKQLRAVFTDGEKDLSAVWFNFQFWQIAGLQPGITALLEGELKEYKGSLQMVHPTFEIMSDEGGDLDLPEAEEAAWHGRELLPVYPACSELSQSFLRKIISRAYEDYGSSIKETIPGYILKKYELLDLQKSIQALHFPETREIAEAGRKRLIFEELFYHQMMLARAYKNNKDAGRAISFVIKKNHTTRLKNSLPFSLTRAQKRVLREIVEDMQSGRRMNRLLQGDVGSGKTIIALFAMLLAIENDYQAIMLVPTEILAKQHYQTITGLLANQPEIEINLILGGNKKGTDKALEQINKGLSKLIIGTHALLEEKVVFNKTGLVVIDEQQRFGVQQRATLPGKKGYPDILYLSATPIPRSLALTIYGDLDISVLDELPPNRKPVKTIMKVANKKEEFYERIPELIAKGNQIYIVCPLISETQKLDLLDAERLFKYLKEEKFPGYRIELIHSRMKSADKEAIMKKFQENKVDILVSTTVIEVGVDVPNASVMIIEHAERFGLSQLHQLRGRVGRGSDLSYCFLICSHPLSQAARQRLKVMIATTDGFKIAEKDLEIRGPGDFFGKDQSGIPVFRFTNLNTDLELLNLARAEARKIVLEDYTFLKPENNLIKKRYLSEYLSKERLFSF